MTEKHLTNTRFDEFELHPSLLAGLADAGFTYCTPIQEASLPLIVKGKDIAGQAQTGTGKTAAFLVGGLQYLILHPAPPERRPNQPRMLILAPTRELAVQIHKDAMLLAKHTDFRFGLVYGGTGYEKQRNEVEAGVDVLIGTPGRLIDYFKQRVFDLNRAQAVVLDEADRMFDLGFIKDIRFLLRRMPPPEKRLGMLFSATLSFRVSELAYEHMNNPQSVKIETDRVTAEKVEQRCYMTANEEKIPLLIGLMRHMDPTRSIVFVNTKREADRVWGYLEGNGLHAAILSGDVPQNKRLALLKSFQEGELPVLVATDVAARGLHIPDVSHVFNYDLPEDAEDYVHRIGRTARAGASGDAISFVCERFAFSLPDIEAFIGHKLPMESVTAELLADVPHGSRMPSPERKPRDKGGRRDKSSSRPCGEGRSGKSGDGPPKQPRRRRRKPAAGSPAGG